MCTNIPDQNETVDIFQRVGYIIIGKENGNIIMKINNDGVVKTITVYPSGGVKKMDETKTQTINQS